MERLTGSPSQVEGAIPVFHDPGDALETSLGPDFRESIVIACEQACSDRAIRELVPLRTEGRWRLVQGWHPQRHTAEGVSLHPVSQAKGISAGGAACRGWRFTMLGKWPHDKLVVIAPVETRSRVGSVTDDLSNGIPEKVKSIVSDARFDTILVATKEHAELVASSLGENPTGIRVIFGERHDYQMFYPQGHSSQPYQPPSR
jgi:hypothetical protein